MIVLALASGPLFPQQSAVRAHAPDESGTGALVAGLRDLVPTPGIASGFARLGDSATSLGDLDGDGKFEFLVGLGGLGGASNANSLLFYEDEAESGHHRHHIGFQLGGFEGQILPTAGFGTALCTLEDLDGDGIPEVAVGSPWDQRAGTSYGAVWILFLDRHGEVREEVLIAASSGGFTGELDDDDGFGRALACGPDLDGDGRRELFVGAPGDDDAGGGTGAVWVLSLANDGTVTSQEKLVPGAGGFSVALDSQAAFGSGLAALGDLDGDGVDELVIGAPLDDTNGSLWVLFFDAAGSLVDFQEISASTGGLAWTFAALDELGSGLASLGDVDGDGRDDLVAGVAGFARTGYLLHLFLGADGTVQGVQPLGPGLGGFGGTLDPGAGFGRGLAALGDLDGDGQKDLFVGAPEAEDPAVTAPIGEFWLVTIGPGGLATSERRFGGVYQWTPVNGRFGSALARLGDLDGDGTTEVLVSMPNGVDLLQTLSLDAAGNVVSFRRQSLGAFGASTQVGFGRSLSAFGDLDLDGRDECAVGAPFSTTVVAGPQRGSVWVAFLAADGSITSLVESNGDSPALAPFQFQPGDEFGASLAPLGDLDADGTFDLAVGAPGFDLGGLETGAVYLLFMRPDGTVREALRLAAATVGLAGELAPGDRFGTALASVGDLDGNGVGDLAVGAPGGDLPWFPDTGLVWILYLDGDGRVLARRSIGCGRNGFSVSLWSGDAFGQSLAVLGDRNGDGLPELVVGAGGDDDGGTDVGALWLLGLRADGRVRNPRQLSRDEGGFPRPLFSFDRFGAGLANLGDLDGDGRDELGLGAPEHDHLGRGVGYAWTLFLP